MDHYFGGSLLTLLLTSLLVVSGPALGGTTGTPDAELERIEGEAAAAQNALDSELLKPGAKPTDAKVKEKAKALEEKTKELHEEFRKRTIRPKESSRPKSPAIVDTDGSDDHSDDRNEPESSQKMDPSPVIRSPAPSEASAPNPGPTLSGEGIKSEITYPKKTGAASKKKPSVDPAASPIPTPSPSEIGGGISEIHYPKKTSKKKDPETDSE